MPEDEAIDFTFKMGVDTAHGVAQSMSEESTLKREDVPQAPFTTRPTPAPPLYDSIFSRRRFSSHQELRVY